ncbi:hypothetical protein L227DRAFT_375171 [Lentinus tigrinus ALCF2SS1-6]|uniref:Uncharacterized protein n=1 Tax=Lentinus tigrinus ALCF2SS1-6 TaxID=1328759 RepID=A0A5C2RRY3_9APHY|nr:hypothetical protein L227DRAFT_375171 [Lentinus tigrinus ALCF2SS1-6]
MRELQVLVRTQYALVYSEIRGQTNPGTDLRGKRTQAASSGSHVVSVRRYRMKSNC